MRAGQPHAARVAWEEPWAEEFAPVPGASGFQVVLRGTCRLLRDHAEPVELREGDVVLLPDGRGHTAARLRRATDVPPTAVAARSATPRSSPSPPPSSGCTAQRSAAAGE